MDLSYFPESNKFIPFPRSDNVSVSSDPLKAEVEKISGEISAPSAWDISLDIILGILKISLVVFSKRSAQILTPFRVSINEILAKTFSPTF